MQALAVLMLIWSAFAFMLRALSGQGVIRILIGIFLLAALGPLLLAAAWHIAMWMLGVVAIGFAVLFVFAFLFRLLGRVARLR